MQKKGQKKPPVKAKEQKKKESILDLERYRNQKIIVKYQGGRQVVGVLKGFDPLQNLVLDDTFEYLQDCLDPTEFSGEMRKLGLVVCRATAIILISPFEGTVEIDNPFA
jgi:U6 snRNA-associated Sm-like protein LSm7